MRCVACDCALRQGELSMTKDDGNPEDMCSDCRGIAYSAEFIDTHEYHHSRATEMLDLHYSFVDSDSQY